MSKEQPRIEVVMTDGTNHYFTPQVFDILLDHKRVSQFRRSSGWVRVGVDPIRKKSRISTYDGAERRSSVTR